MKNNVMRVVIKQVLVAAMVFMSWSCSRYLASFVYNRADSFMLDKIDDYFDVSDSQEAMLGPRLKVLHQWHRNYEMPHYERLLTSLYRDVSGGLTAQEYDRIYNQLKIRRDTTFLKIIPDSAAFLVTVKPGQVNTLKKEMQESNEELEELVAMSKQQRRQKLYENFEEFFEDYVGDLNEQQQARLRGLVNDFPDRSAMRLKYRKLRQQQFASLLLSPEGRDKKHVAAVLKSWLVPIERGYPAPYRTVLNQYYSSIKNMILQIDATLTADQRQHLKDKILSLRATVSSMRKG